MKQKIHIIMTELFEATLIFYLILMLVETLKTGFVSSVINPGYMLIPVVLSALIMVITDRTDSTAQPEKESLRESDMYFLLLSGIGSGGLIYFNSMHNGWVAYVIAGTVSLCVIFVSYLVISE